MEELLKRTSPYGSYCHGGNGERWRRNEYASDDFDAWT